MAMVRSRPGFQTQIIEDQTQPASPARLNHDMLPALAKRTAATTNTSKSPLTANAPGNALPPFVDPAALQASADAAFARMQAEQRAIAAKTSPDVLVNPSPSEPPIMTSPYEE